MTLTTQGHIADPTAAREKPQQPPSCDERLQVVSTTLFSLLVRLGRRTLADQTRHLAAHGITPAQYGVLAILLLKERMSFKEIGSLAVVDGSVLTRIVDQLEKKGFARRTADHADRRRVTVELTDVGHRLLAAARPVDDRGTLCNALQKLGPGNAEVLLSHLVDLGHALGDRNHDQIIDGLFSYLSEQERLVHDTPSPRRQITGPSGSGRRR